MSESFVSIFSHVSHFFSALKTLSGFFFLNSIHSRIFQMMLIYFVMVCWFRYHNPWHLCFLCNPLLHCFYFSHYLTYLIQLVFLSSPFQDQLKKKKLHIIFFSHCCTHILLLFPPSKRISPSYPIFAKFSSLTKNPALAKKYYE